MLRDVFYYGNKPNVHPREKFAVDLADARRQNTTEHFWIINEYCDYTNFDWDWDFDFLPDEDIWAEKHNNVWPSNYQKDSGTWLCTEEDSDVTIYRSDVEPIKFKKYITHNWKILESIDESMFDFGWHPDPSDPPYIYVFGNQWHPGTVMPTVEYHVPDASERKYVTDMIAYLVPKPELFTIIQEVTNFDFSWSPNPCDPPYIYVWGNKYIPGALHPTLEYHTPGATDRKYMDEIVDVLPEVDKWKEFCAIDKTKFDMSWRPDPREPAYIYVWGNKYIPGTLQPTLEYHTPGATDRKYMDETVEVLPEHDRWKILHPIDKTKFDMSWRPDPREPAYIYVWGNQWHPSTVMPTLEYHTPGATDRKYMDDAVACLLPKPEMFKTLYHTVDFDYSWVPDPNSPPYIYVFGNSQHDAYTMPTVEYHVNGAVEKHYITDITPKLVSRPEDFEFLEDINLVSFDFSWVPDPNSPPYIYAWGNQWHRAEDKISMTYTVEGATEYKYMTAKVKRKPSMNNWVIPNNLNCDSFDFSWEPHPKEPPYIYQFGTQWQKTGGPRYVVDGATEIKYFSNLIAIARPASHNIDKWKIPKNVNQAVFDFSWHPDDTSPPYIYQFPSRWSRTGGPRFEIEGATEIKYMDKPVAIVKQDMTHWHIPEGLDTTDFDFSWHPDVEDTPYIYQFGTQWQKTNGPIFTAPGCNLDSPVKYIDVLKATRLPNKTNWIIPPGYDDTKFDFSWHPDATSPSYIYQFGTLLDEKDGPTYVVPGNNGVTIHIERKEIVLEDLEFPKYQIKTTLEDLIEEHDGEIFWALNPELDYSDFDFKWVPDKQNVYHVNAFGSKDNSNSQTYFVNGKMWQKGYRDINYVEDKIVEVKTKIDMFFVDKGNAESQERYNALVQKYGNVIKTRYLNSWVDTINRCITKSTTNLCWILNSELDYSNFEFDFYPSPWQMRMVHIFGTQWSHWGTTFMINKNSFADDTKYVKIIEHLSNLNFVKRKIATATNCLYDIIVIDHGNKEIQNVCNVIKDKTGKDATVIKYSKGYLQTFKSLLKTIQPKKEHYLWVCSSICDYENFDFSYICDPYAKDQLHVFPSDKQKFGDTFLIDVNKFNSLIADMIIMEDYVKVNYNQHQKVKRLPAPTIITKEDTHVTDIHTDFDWPYATFITEDNKELQVNDVEPMNLWAPDTKNILVTSTGGTRIIVPKEAKDYVKNELYDYPYISKINKQFVSKPLDIVFLSNGETGADENYEHLLKVTKGLPNRVVRVDGVNGRVAAYHAAASASETPWMFTVFAKLRVNDKFDWTWQPDRLQIPKHYIFNATNPVNRLEYGHQAMIAYNKKITLANVGRGLDFTLDDEHEVVEMNSGVAMYNTDEWSTWRTAFREALKLRADDSQASKDRLDAWLNVGEGNFAQYSCEGARHAIEYYESVNGDLDKLRLSYDWPWLKEYFNNKYK